MSSWVVELSEFNDLQQTPEAEQWTLYVDGSSNPKGTGAGIILEGPNNILIKKIPTLRLQDL